MHEQPTKPSVELSQSSLNEKLLEKFRKAAESKGLNSEETEYFSGLVNELMAIRGDKTDAQLSDPDNVEDFGRYSDKMREIVNFANEKKIVLEYDVGKHKDVLLPDRNNGEMFVTVKKENDLMVYFDENGNQIGPEFSDRGNVEFLGGKVSLEIVKTNGKSAVINHEGKEIGGEYDEVSRFSDTGDKVFLKVQKENALYVIVNSEGEEIGGEFKEVKQHVIHKGKLHFLVQAESGGLSIIDEDGEMVVEESEDLSPGLMLPDFCKMETVGGNLFYNAVVNRQMVIMCEDGPVSKKYKYISSPQNMDGNLFFLVRKTSEPKKHAIVDKDGHEVGGDFYYTSDKLTAVGSSVAFKVSKKKESGFSIVNGKTNKRSKEYSLISDIVNIGGKIFFIATMANGNVAVIDEKGKKVGGEFSLVSRFEEIGGKLVFRVSNSKGEISIIDHQGKPVGGKYKAIYDLVDIAGKITFSALTTDEKKVIIHEDHKEPIGGEFKSVGEPQMVGGEMYFKAHDIAGEWFLINGSGEKIGDGYSFIWEVYSLDNKVFASVVKEDGSYVIIDEKGEEICQDYKFIVEPVATGGGFAFCGKTNETSYEMLNESGELIGEYDAVHDYMYHDGKLTVVAERDGKLVKETYFIK